MKTKQKNNKKKKKKSEYLKWTNIIQPFHSTQYIDRCIHNFLFGVFFFFLYFGLFSGILFSTFKPTRNILYVLFWKSKSNLMWQRPRIWLLSHEAPSQNERQRKRKKLYNMNTEGVIELVAAAITFTTSVLLYNLNTGD